MADLTGIQTKRNAGVALTKTAGAASQTISMDRRDEKILLLIENGNDTEDCEVKFTAAIGDDLVVNVDAGEFAIVGCLESAKFKIAEKVTVQILDQDGSEYSGTVGLVTLTQINSPISLTN